MNLWLQENGSCHGARAEIKPSGATLSPRGVTFVCLCVFRAAELMTRTGSVVTLEVAKQGAIYHGLATLLNQPSPMMQRCEHILHTLARNV